MIEANSRLSEVLIISPSLLTDSMRQIAHDPSQNARVRRFMETFEYRKNADPEKDGYAVEADKDLPDEFRLALALTKAVSVYSATIKPYSEDELLGEWLSGNEEPVDDLFKSSLMLATEKASLKGTMRIDLTGVLRRQGINMQKLTQETLTPHLASALDAYVGTGDLFINEAW